MSEQRDPFVHIKKWLSNDDKNDNDKKKISKRQYLLIFLVIGIAFMLVGNYFNKQNRSSDPLPVYNDSDEKADVETLGKNIKNEPSSMVEYERYYENQLKDALESIVGVQDVTVVVNVMSTEKKVFESNTIQRRQKTEETDSNGGKRTVEDISTDQQMVLIREGDKEVPIVSQSIKPEIKGVLIVAKGAEHIQVKNTIVEAVTRVLDVPSHRVSVQAKK